MINKFLKKLVAGIVVLILLLPAISFADENISKDTLTELQKRIDLLINEVNKLQELLSQSYTLTITHPPLSDGEIKTILHGGVNWFKNAQEESGHFKYEYLPYENEYLDDDNIVRQAGGLYVLGEILVHDVNENYGLKETVEKSITFFESLTVNGNVDGVQFRCIGNSEVNHLCQLGATSLALIGVIDLVERYPELAPKYDSLIQDYGKYIIAMKKDGTGFRGTYNEGGKLSNKESSFSNGEALLALARLYKYSPNEELKKVIDDSFEYFESPQVEFDFPLYLWAMAALKDMNDLWNDRRYVDYAKDYTEWRINGFRYRKGSTHNMCAYIEGVISAYSVVDGGLSDIERKRYLDEINYWLYQSKMLQLGETDTVRIINDDSGVRFGEIENTSAAFGGFITDQNKLTQRIDFTQHCLNSYLQKLVDIDQVSI